MMDTTDKYKIFKLKNREFALTVDMARMPCGLNGAVYFVEMDADGGVARGNGGNQAGAAYGTGYCDAQCPHDMKFINGKANIVDWNSTSDPPVGKYGICCAEMDIWEANSRSTAYTPHPCKITGPYECGGQECGDNDSGDRYKGVCDKDGCDFNSWRMGNHTFYGRNGHDFTIDSTRPLTVVTQFVTSDGTDAGDLVDIRREYWQDGQLIHDSESLIPGVQGNSISDAFCIAQKAAFGDPDDFTKQGGLKSMGDALDRGMVLVMSLWDDSLSDMLWLDSDYPLDKSVDEPGVSRGPCNTDSGRPSYVREKYPMASVKYQDIKVGPIGTTQRGEVDSAPSTTHDIWGDDRRLREGDLHV
jgi:cellulose 1,4-beta-cellobiosidase